MKKVLLIGGTGRIGPGIIEEYLDKYQKHYKLILGYHNKKTKYDLESRKVDLSSISSLKKAMIGISVVINMAANSDEKADFLEILEPNIVGAYNVFEAARETRVKRVIYASSVHAIKGYPLNYRVNHLDVPKPINFYGASKVFGEALCNVFASKYNLSCLAIRIGAYVSNDKRKVVCFTRENYNYVITQRDMAQLIHRCILAPEKIKFGILSGISNNKKKNMELEFTKKLVGYKPQDDAYKICNEVKRKSGGFSSFPLRKRKR